MKYQLIEAHAIRKPHQGLIVTAYYLPKTEDKTALLTKPHKMVMFNRWPPVEVEADYVEVKLNGVYAYPNGTKTETIRTFCPKDKDGNYLNGYNPEDVIHYQQNILRKVSDLLTFHYIFFCWTCKRLLPLRGRRTGWIWRFDGVFPTYSKSSKNI